MIYKNTRFLFYARVRNMFGGGEAAENADSFLKNPLDFRLRHIDTLSRLAEQNQLSEENKAQFREMVAYHIGLNSSKLQTVPDRILPAVEGNPRLMALLGDDLSKTLRTMITSRGKRLLGILNKPTGQWRTEDMTTAMSLYTGIRRRGVNHNGATDSLFEKARDAFVGKANELLRSGETNADLLTRAQGLSLVDSLFVLEVHRLFPGVQDWASTEFAGVFEAMASETANKLAIQAEGDNFTADGYVAAELIESMQGTNTLLAQRFAARNMDHIHQLARRGKAAQFVAFAEKNDVLLPMHVRALNQIMTDPAFAVEATMVPEQDRNGPTHSAEMAQNRARLIQLQRERERLERHLFETFLAEGAGEETDMNGTIRTAYESLQGRRETANEEIDELLSDVSTTLLAEVASHAAFTPAQQTAMTDEITALQEEITEMGDLSPEARNDVLRRLERVYQRAGRDFKRDADSWNRVKDLVAENAEIERQYDGMRQRIVQERDVLLQDAELQRLEAEIARADQAHRVANRHTQNPRGNEFSTYFNDLRGSASRIYSTYTLKLRDRFKAGNLRGADVQVLLGATERGSGTGALRSVMTDGRTGELVFGREELDQITQFRTQFEKALRAQVGKVNLRKSMMSSQSDAQSAWLAELDKHLSWDKLSVKLEGQLRGAFETGQYKREVMQGAMAYFRSQPGMVLDTIRGQLGATQAESLLAEWGEMHATNQSPEEISRMNGVVESINNQKDSLRGRVETGHQTHTAHMEAISAYELTRYLADRTTLGEAANTFANELRGHQKRESLLGALQSAPWRNGPPNAAELSRLADRIQLESVYDYAADGVRYGTIISENGQKFHIPGQESIAQLKMATADTEAQLNAITEDFQREVAHLRKLIQRRASGDKRVSEADISMMRNGILRQFESVSSKMKTHLTSLERAGNKHLPEDVSVNLFGNGRKAALARLQQLKTYFEKETSDVGSLTGKEGIFGAVPEYFAQTSSLYDLNNGFLQRESNGYKNALERHNTGLQVLKQYGFHDDLTRNKSKEFKEKIEEMRIQYQAEFARFQGNVQNVQRILQDDIAAFADDPQGFATKHKITMEEAIDRLNQLEYQTEVLGSLNEEYNDKQFFKKWWKRYNAGVPERTEALQQMADWENMGQAAAKMAADSGHMGAWLQANKELENQTGWRSFWKGSIAENARGERQTFSLMDIYRVIEQTIEANRKDFQRRTDRTVSNIGVGLYGVNNGTFAKWGAEFKKLGEDSEGTRVADFVTQWEDEAGWDCREGLYRTKDADEARALIGELIRKGHFMWDDPRMWRTLNRLQSGVVFNIPDDMALDRRSLMKKINKAMINIWTHSVYAGWKKGYEEQYTRQEDLYARDFKEMEAVDGAYDNLLTGMLTKWVRGDLTVTPAKFEAYLKWAFDNGKMNGVPDRRIWYLLSAVSTLNAYGQPLISVEAMSRINGDHLVRLPHLDFLTDGTSWKKDGRIVPAGTPGSRQGTWTRHDMNHWAEMLTDNGRITRGNSPEANARMKEFYFYNIVQSPISQQRVERFQRFSRSEMDHDDATMYSSFWTADDVMKILTRDSDSNDKISPDALRNYLAGFDAHVRGIVDYLDYGDARWGDAPYWLAQRKKNLEKMGQVIRAMQTAIQMSKGNFSGLTDSPRIFGDHEFKRNEDDYTKNGSFDFSDHIINNFTETLFQESGVGNSGHYMDMLRSRNNSDYRWDVARENRSEQFHQDMGHLMSDRNEAYHDLSAIERTMRSYVGDNRNDASTFFADQMRLETQPSGRAAGYGMAA